MRDGWGFVGRCKDVFSYGPYKGKINLNIWSKLKDKPNGP